MLKKRKIPVTANGVMDCPAFALCVGARGRARLFPIQRRRQFFLSVGEMCQTPANSVSRRITQFATSPDSWTNDSKVVFRFPTQPRQREEAYTALAWLHSGGGGRGVCFALPVEVGCWLPCGFASKGTSGQHANYNVGLQKTCVVATGRRSHPGIVGGERGVGG